MNKKDYLTRLKIGLQGLPVEEVEDILSDYEEHFQIGMSKGKSEEEISHELGDPREVAAGYRLNQRTNQNTERPISPSSNDNGRKFVMGLLLVLVNIIVLFAPAMALIGILIGFLGMGLGFAFGGLGLVLRLPFVFIGNSPHILTSLGLGFGMGALGLLILILGGFIIKQLFILIRKYVRWNIELVNK